MDITFFKITERKPMHDQKCWCKEKDGHKFVGKYCEQSNMFTDLDNGLPLYVEEWALLM